MKSGYPINDPANRGAYDAANPYVNRDPRFYTMIFYNTAQAKKDNSTPVMYTFENWSNGGKDAAGAKATNSLTNYHIKKFVSMGLNWSDPSITRQPHSKFLIRWAHMVTALEPLPAALFHLSDPGNIVIKAGKHSGYVEITPDSAAFLNDSLKTINATYILPFYIKSADADSILETKRQDMIGIRFENMLFGNYYHGGKALINRPAKSDTTISYRLTTPASETKVWALTTIGPNTLTANAYYSVAASAKQQLKIVLKGTNIYISSATGSSYTFLPDGPSTFNKPKLLQDRMLILKYMYTDPVTPFWTYHCTDTLKFRNRIRDGINEWYDENTSHYN